MAQEDYYPKSQLTKKWIIVPVVLAMLITSITVISLFGTFCTEQNTKSILANNLDFLLHHVEDRAGVLFHVNASSFAVANSLKSTMIDSFSELEKKVAPRLFVALLTTQFATQISYVRKEGLVFSYERQNGEINVIFSNNSGPCSFYNQKIDQQTGARNGNIVALKCNNETKQRYLGAFDSERSSQYESVYGETLTFTFPVGNFNGVVSIGVDLKDILKYVSNVGFVGEALFFAINGSAPHQILVPSDQNGSVLLSNDTGSSYEYLSSRYQLRSINIDIGRIPLVFTVAFPYKQIMTVFQVIKIILFSFFSLTAIFLTILIIITVKLLKSSQIKETILRAELIKQKEAVQQAERKSMNKSMAFAQASHDVRNSLYSITGLIDNCHAEVAPESELARDLEDMKSCASNLLGILNSILDTSKVESGKMHLQVSEFDISKMIEESVDFLNAGQKKGLEIIWDPCDFSLLKLGKVRGDAMRFKQILDNLLGNAVKFTNEGGVVLRAWARKPDLKIMRISSDYGFSFSGLFCGLSKVFLRNRRNENEQHEITNSVQNDPSAIELIFEVDDTGLGIPLEKRASVFENYVQIKEGSLFANKDKEDKPQGTGLGLGIVQSFVRLMGGEISIKDKEPREKGTCFRFNIFLSSSEFHNSSAKDEEKESTGQFPIFNESSTAKGVHSLLFVHGCETKKILTRWMESLGIKVSTVQEIKQISPTLQRIKQNLNSSSKSDSVLFRNTFSRNSSSQEREGFLSAGRIRAVDSAQWNTYFGVSLKILIIIDISKGNLSEIWSSLRDFIAENPFILCKIVCISDLTTSSQVKQKFKSLPNCNVIRKPIHGSKLQSLFELIQELEKMDEGLKKEIDDLLDENKKDKELVKQNETLSEIRIQNEDDKQNETLPEIEVQIEDNKRNENLPQRRIQIEDNKPLNGIKILCAEDNPTLRRIALKILVHLGATVELAENGLIALQLVKQALETGITREGGSYSFTYDVILMDCQMPLLSGYEATQAIREEEARYGIHIPIIALTANTGEEEERKSTLAGIDLHMPKPLERNRILDAIGVVLGNKT